MKNNCALIHLLVIPVFVLAPVRSLSQQALVQVPRSTPLPIQLGKHVPMKKGEPLQAYLLYPVYAENRLVIPAGSALRGKVVKLNADRSHRIHSRLWGDFTPFHIPVVQFDRGPECNGWGTGYTPFCSTFRDPPFVSFPATVPREAAS
jgi:hypothetical protein